MIISKHSYRTVDKLFFFSAVMDNVLLVNNYVASHSDVLITNVTVYVIEVRSFYKSTFSQLTVQNQCFHNAQKHIFTNLLNRYLHKCKKINYSTTFTVLSALNQYFHKCTKTSFSQLY